MLTRHHPLIRSLSRICATQFVLFLFKKKEAHFFPLYVQLFTNVLSQWKIQRTFKKQSGVERSVDQRKQYSYKPVLPDSTRLCKSTHETSSCSHFPHALAQRHMICKCTIGISTAVVCLNIVKEITDNLSVAHGLLFPFSLAFPLCIVTCANGLISSQQRAI